MVDAIEFRTGRLGADGAAEVVLHVPNALGVRVAIRGRRRITRRAVARADPGRGVPRAVRRLAADVRARQRRATLFASSAARESEVASGILVALGLIRVNRAAGNGAARPGPEGGARREAVLGVEERRRIRRALARGVVPDAEQIVRRARLAEQLVVAEPLGACLGALLESGIVVAVIPLRWNRVR